MAVTVARITDRCVRISVRDGSRILPCLIDAGPAAECGRGMALVHHLTGGHWGATPEPYGKTVHADLRTRSTDAGFDVRRALSRAASARRRPVGSAAGFGGSRDGAR